MPKVIQLGGTLALTINVAAVSAQTPQPTDAPPIEEIVVTGSYLGRRTESNAISPLEIVTHEELAAAGANEFSDVIERLTINSGSQNNPDGFTQNLSTGTTSVNLRGLGVGATLVLVNGRRQTPSAVTTDRGESFVDTSSLPPLIALDRVEILRDGAAALYGSDAVAGVVNLITRDDFRGFDLQVDLQSAAPHSHSDRQLSALFGAGSDSTHFLAAFNTRQRSALSAADRRLSGPQDDLSQAGNPGSYLILSRPDDSVYGPLWTRAFDDDRNGVADALGPPVEGSSAPGLPLPVLADPDCETLATTDPRVVPQPGGSVPGPDGEVSLGLCLFDFGDFYALVPEETQHAGYVGVTSSLGNDLEGHIEFHTARNESHRSNSPSFPFSSYPQIDSSHPDNPFGAKAQFIGRVLGSGGAASESLHKSDTRRLAASISGNLSGAWRWETALQSSTNSFVVAADDVLADRFDLALRGLGGTACSPQTGIPGTAHCLYFNPFGSALTGSGTRNSPELLASLIAPFQLSATSELITLDAVLTGNLPRIGRIAVGGERREERINYRYDENSRRDNFLFFAGATDFSGARDVVAVFAELALPVFNTLTLQLAARNEDYGGHLRSTDPKISLFWKPGPAVTLRSSVGSSFRAPSLFQSAGTQTSLAELIDPTIGVPQFFPVRTQPNPDDEGLTPERADTFHLSVDWTPTAALQLSFAYWSFNYTDVIIRQNPQALLLAATQNSPESNSQIDRDPASGSLLQVNAYYDNASKLKTAGFDLSLNYSAETRRYGSVQAGAAATLTRTYDLIDPQLGRVNGVGRRNFANFATSAPAVRSNLFLNWRREKHGVNLHLNYIGSYVDDEIGIEHNSSTFARIDDHLSVDLQYSFRMTDRLEFAIGAINLLDAAPPHVATNGGYDSKVHDPLGRLLYLRARFEL